MDRPSNPGARHVKVAIMDESELVVHGLRAMLEPHSTVITVVPRRPDGPTPLCDLTLYDMAARSIMAGGVHYRDVFDTNLPGFVWLLVIVRRTLKSDGGSRAFIGSSAVPAATLREWDCGKGWFVPG